MTQPQPTQPSPQILDPQALHRLREGGGVELVVELIDLFLADGPALVEQVRGSVGDSLARAAHALKGSCLSLGLTQLGQVCRSIEDALQHGQPLEPLLDSVAEAYQQAERALARARDEARLSLPPRA